VLVSTWPLPRKESTNDIQVLVNLQVCRISASNPKSAGANIEIMVSGDNISKQTERLASEHEVRE